MPAFNPVSGDSEMRLTLFEAIRPLNLRTAARDILAGVTLREVQDRAIRDAVAMQEALGLPIVTDGEFRRAGWSRGFLSAVEGFDFRPSKLTFRNDDGFVTPSPAVLTTRPVRRTRPIVTDDYKFLKSVAKNRIKVTMPTPSHMHFGQFKDAVDLKVYPTSKHTGRPGRGVSTGDQGTLRRGLPLSSTRRSAAGAAVRQ